MTEVTSHAPGTPCWVDASSDDVDASKGFYTGLFGWDAEDQFHPESGLRIYTLFLLDGRKVAGLGGKPPGFEQTPNVWNTNFATPYVDAAVGRVTDAGGQVLMPPMDVMDQGKMAVCLDPTGAGFALWQPGTMRGVELMDVPGAFTWAELMTGDVESAKSFYSAVFGWTYQNMDIPDGMTYTLVEGGENSIAGLMGRPEDVPDEVPDNWSVYFDVEDVDRTLARALELGGEEAFAPMYVPTVGRMAGIVDPVGAAFSVIMPEA
jgi:uncharacterized protein